MKYGKMNKYLWYYLLSVSICVILYLPGEGNICISLELDIFSFTNTPEGL